MNLETVEISIGLIRINSSYVCLKRSQQPYKNALEFPGGKKQPHESNSDCLKRELYEELNIKLLKFKFIATIKHRYEDIIVKIHIYRIFRFSGEMISNEGRDIVFFNDNSKHELLPTHNRVLNTLRLPKLLKIITLENIDDLNLHNINLYKYIRLRDISYQTYKNNIELKLSQDLFFGKLIIDYPHNLDWHDDYSGVHFKNKYIENFNPQHRDNSRLYSASCHSKKDINLINMRLFDFILISPVIESPYGKDSLGWSKFNDLSNDSYLPTYALGGVCSSGYDFSDCISNHGFGLAGIKKF